MGEWLRHSIRPPCSRTGPLLRALTVLVMSKTEESPYLSSHTRLADVIAAIQAMGTYKFYKLDFRGWAKRISGDPENYQYWKNIIEEHPEFFRLDENRSKASLVWRRNYQRTYHVDENKELSRGECNDLPDNIRKERISRLPLTSSDISVLIETAVNLHSRALEKQNSENWWKSPSIGLAGVVIGGLMTKFL